MCTARSLIVSRSICHACPPATHAPYHACSPCHTCPPPCMPPCHACSPCHTCPPHACPPAMHAPCHTCPPAMHAPLLPIWTAPACERVTLLLWIEIPFDFHACPLPQNRFPATHPHACPPTMHAPLPCTFFPCHAHPPPMDRILDTRFWKYYLAPTSLRAVITQMRRMQWII